MLNDLRYALRQLVKRPGFSLIALGTLAIGIGVTTAIFSVVDHLVWRDLPFQDPERIVTVWQDNQREGVPREDVAPGNFFDWKERNRVFDALGAADPYSMDLTGDGRPEVIFAALVTDGFFEALGARVVRGRLLGPEDYREGAGKVAVISHGMWQRRFGGDTAIVGRTLVLDGEPVGVVGVLQPDFDLGLMYSVRQRELWLPRLTEGWELQHRASSWWTVVGRLKPGISLAQARADMDRVAATLAAEYPATNEGIGVTLVPLHEHLVGAARPALFLLLGAVGLVLVIACVNVANLQLARGTGRLSEFSVRSALGAERHRLVRQLLTESIVLALLGSALGVFIAYWGVDLIRAISPGEIPRLETVAVDVRVLGFALILGVASAIGFGLAPAIQFSRPRLQEGLKEGRVTASRGRQRLRGTLVVTEMALALTLLVGAGLLLRSFAAVLSVDPGIRTDNLLALQVFYHNDEDTAEDRIHFFERSLGALEALPGVRSAGAVLAAPFLAANLDIRRTFRLADEPAPRQGEELFTYVSTATPRYFETVGIPLLRGRRFNESDRLDAPPVALINETLRRRYWGAKDPIGDRLLLGESERPIEIVGVVGDVRHAGLEADPRPELFVPHAQSGTGSMTYFIRTAGEPQSVMAAAQQAIWDLAASQTFYQTGTVEQLISTTLTGRRFIVVLLSVFAGIALAMAAVGIYGVMSFTVSQRTHEVGIRMALGADRPAVVRMVVGQGLQLAGVGILLGLAIAFFVTKLMTNLLYQIPPTDGVSFSGAVLVLAGVALLACHVPARRATRVDPMVALRHE